MDNTLSISRDYYIKANKARPIEPLNLYFLTLPQLMDYFECKERANYKHPVFRKLWAEVMREKYNKTEDGEDIDETPNDENYNKINEDNLDDETNEDVDQRTKNVRKRTGRPKVSKNLTKE